VPIVTIKTLSASVARSGAVLPHVVTPWANLSGAGMNSALPQNSCAVLASTLTDLVAPRVTAVTTRPFAVTGAGLPIDIRKQQYVHMTRVNVGGDGAAGPHPEREPA
jgi:Tfp pilus tip-associated adhesin PilY1